MQNGNLRNNKLRGIRLIAFVCVLTMFLQGCAIADIYLDQKNPNQPSRGAGAISAFTENEAAFSRCLSELGDLLEPEENTLYDLRPRDETRIVIQKHVPLFSLAESYADNTVLASFMQDRMFTVISLYNDVVYFNAPTAGVYKGIAFVPSGDPMDIRYFCEDMEFVPDGDGYMCRQEEEDHSFYYSWIKENWYYFEVRI